ncbi:MAG: ATP-binding protein [Desulfobacterales bacterium]|nr:ATP-binding protein [Desulfobacterales bacterium]
MKKHLIFKLLGINLAVIFFVVVIVWISINTLAADYFVTLMEKYNISPGPAHDMFVSAVHRYLIRASLAAAVITVVLSFLMMRRVLKPLTRMTEKTREIASGNFAVRVSAHTDDEIGQLARADASHGNLKLEPTDIRELVQTSIETFHQAISQKSISMNLHAAPGPIIVPADRKQIARVLRNFTDNAVRYTPQNNDVEIHIESNLSRIQVSFTNSCGDLIPSELPFIFERFYRGEKSRSRQHGGAGIGLAIVKELVKAHA